MNWSLIASDTDNNYVLRDVYCYYGNPTNNTAFNDGTHVFPYLVTKYFNEAFTQTVYNAGFSDVLTEINNENFLAQLAGQPQLPRGSSAPRRPSATSSTIRDTVNR